MEVKVNWTDPPQTTVRQSNDIAGNQFFIRPNFDPYGTKKKKGQKKPRKQRRLAKKALIRKQGELIKVCKKLDEYYMNRIFEMIGQ